MAIAIEHSTTHFNRILNKVRDAGLLEKQPKFYVIRLVAITLFSLVFWFLSGLFAALSQQHKAWIVAAFVSVALLGILSDSLLMRLHIARSSETTISTTR
jgi:phosphoglycerol transferase MdoB-like AlkP superfamily enzyme